MGERSQAEGQGEEQQVSWSRVGRAGSSQPLDWGPELREASTGVTLGGWRGRQGLERQAWQVTVRNLEVKSIRLHDRTMAGGGRGGLDEKEKHQG